MNKKPIQTIPVFIIAGTTASILAGLIFFGFDIFDTKSPLFQILVYGLVGSTSFILFNMKRYRDSVFILLIIFLLDMFIFGFKYPLNRILYFLSAVAGAFLYANYFFTRSEHMKVARPLLLAGIYAILSVFVVLILSLVHHTGQERIFPFINMPIGFLIGLELGAGIELAEYLLIRMEQGS